jgi:hypothetical protein
VLTLPVAAKAYTYINSKRPNISFSTFHGKGQKRAYNLRFTLIYAAEIHKCDITYFILINVHKAKAILRPLIKNLQKLTIRDNINNSNVGFTF